MELIGHKTIKKLNQERHKNFTVEGVSTGRMTQKSELKVGDIIVGRHSIAKLFDVGEHFVSLIWENDILCTDREKLYHKNLIRQKVRLGQWKIYREVSLENLNI